MSSVATLPIGTRFMLSIPLASTMSCVPDITACAANIIACCDDPHWRSIVTAGIESGSFEASTALRPRSIVCSPPWRSEEHTSELQSLMRISYAVFCLKKKRCSIRLGRHRSDQESHPFPLHSKRLHL